MAASYNGTGSRTDSPVPQFLLAGPSSLLSDSRTNASEASCTGRAQYQRRFLLLPHPRTFSPAYFITDADGYCIHELQSLKGDRKVRSWFLNGKDSTGDIDSRGWVIQDGSLHLLSPVDPFFLTLPLIEPSCSAYIPADDLFESAATRHYAQRAKQYNAAIPPNGADAVIEEDGKGGVATWEDIVSYGRLQLARDGLKRCCDVQALDTSETPALAYRPSTVKVCQVLQHKLRALASASCFDAHPLLLDHPLVKQTDLDAPSSQIAMNRLRIAADSIRNYVPKGPVIAGTRAWEDILDQALRQEIEAVTHGIRR